MKRHYQVNVTMPRGGHSSADLIAYESAPEAPDSVQLDLVKTPDISVSAVGEDFFEALSKIRKILELKDILICCQGCRVNVYPSPMSRSMGFGERAYVLTKGASARQEDLTFILENDPQLSPSTLEAQENFYREWLASLSDLK